MNETQALMRKWQDAVRIAAVAALLPSQSWAAAGRLPWDYTLDVVRQFLVGPAAGFLVVTALIGASVLYAFGGHDARTERLAAAGVFTYLVLHVLRLIG
jgi:type IV secretory pathway VirB2 component (pilin)